MLKTKTGVFNTFILSSFDLVVIERNAIFMDPKYCTRGLEQNIPGID